MIHFDIKVNYQGISRVYIRRTHALVKGIPSLYEYEVEYPLGTTHKGHVHHLYDDGALMLIQKVFALINQTS